MREGSPSATAEMVCSWRALESILPSDQRILYDPYARGFLGPVRGKLVDGAAALPKKLRRRVRGVVSGKAKIDWSDASVRRTELGRLVPVGRSVLDATVGNDQLVEARELLERIIDQDIDTEPDDGQGPAIRRGF